MGAPHPAPHAAAALHAPIAASAAAATTGAPAAPGGAAAGVTPPALDPDIAMDHPANQPECADEFGPAPAVAEDDRDDPDNENGGGDNADGTGGGEAKDNGFVVEYCKDCGWECNIAPYKHKSKNNRNCPQRAEEEGYKGRWEYGSKAPNDYVYVHHPITPATVRQKPSDRLFTAREWKANEDAAGEFTVKPPARITVSGRGPRCYHNWTLPSASRAAFFVSQCHCLGSAGWAAQIRWASRQRRRYVHKRGRWPCRLPSARSSGRWSGRRRTPR